MATFSEGDLVWVPGIVVFPGVVRENYDDGQVRVDVGVPVSQEFNADAASLETREPGEWAKQAIYWYGPNAGAK